MGRRIRYTVPAAHDSSDFPSHTLSTDGLSRQSSPGTSGIGCFFAAGPEDGQRLEARSPESMPDAIVA